MASRRACIAFSSQSIFWPSTGNRNRVGLGLFRRPGFGQISLHVELRFFTSRSASTIRQAFNSLCALLCAPGVQTRANQGSLRLELVQMRAHGKGRKPLRFTALGRWRRRGSNPQPLACKASALPIELRPHSGRRADQIIVPRGPRIARAPPSGLAVETRRNKKPNPLTGKELGEASGGSRTRNPRITNAVLCQLKLRWQTVVEEGLTPRPNRPGAPFDSSRE